MSSMVGRVVLGPQHVAQGVVACPPKLSLRSPVIAQWSGFVCFCSA